MATAKTTIELNGKLYDARTGKIISEAGAIAPPKPVQRSKGVVLDGFVRRPATTTPSTHAAKPVAARVKPTTARTKPQHVSAAKLQKSQTLMRPAVKKPAAAVKSDVTVSYKHEQFKKQNPHRVIRATATPRSNHIQRFNPSANQHTIVRKQEVMEVQVAKPTAHQQVAHLATSTEAHVKHSVDAIEESLRNASAHLQTFEDRVAGSSLLQRFGFKNKIANVATLSFAALLLVGFIAYNNAANIEMRIAATRSGVSAGMPGYSPAGFSAVHGIKSEPGKVTVGFKSNTSDKQFTVTQQASNWSSDSLLSNHVLASKVPFQTYQDEGKTVYIYNNSNATWVNGGIWYKVDGDASLTSDQLLRIANSF